MKDRERRVQNALIQEIRESGGQKTFMIGQTPVEVFGQLAALEVRGVVEEIAGDDPFAITYRLKRTERAAGER